MDSAPSSPRSEETVYVPPPKLKLAFIELDRNIAYFLIEGLCLTGAIISFSLLFTIEWVAYEFRFYSFGVAMFLFCLLFAELNRRGKFGELTAWCYAWRYPVVTTFLVLALLDLILLRLSDLPTDCTCDQYDECNNLDECPDGCTDNSTCPTFDPDTTGVRYVTRVLTITCGILFMACILGYWQRASYVAATNDWITAILYMSILGWIWLYFARSLVPPRDANTQKDSWSWHQPHKENRVLSKIVIIMTLVVVFFVVMGAIVLALFGDAANATGDLGTIWGILIFSFLSFIIMITPLAPGSVVDLAAGFLFVTMFVQNEDMDVLVSFLVALAITIVLHFIGSCLQYFCGKIRAVQIWGNKELPPQLLAASDSVLKTANWIKVGIVGQVFMDTANGLNQGRMDMEFCTQFWSEYASIPNAISLVALGTVLAIEGFSAKLQKKYSWSDDAIPLIIMIAWLWQMMGSSWGFKELLQSVHTVSYWTALEKWETVQHFNKLGYTPTHAGWKEDVYELAQGRDGRSPLFDKVKALHPAEIQRTVTKDSAMHYCEKLCKKPEDNQKQRKKMIEALRLDRKRSSVRTEHWDALVPNFDKYVSSGLLKQTGKQEVTVGIFENAEGKMMIVHYLIVLAIYITGIGSYVYISSDIGLDDAVADGLKVLDEVQTIGWANFIVFWVLVIIYFWNSFTHNMKSLFSGIRFVCTGMKVDAEWETVYNTPKWVRNANNVATGHSANSTNVGTPDEHLINVGNNS